ncbi:hypothetical protein HanRHA438_Chr04g0177291 [Helianthus annuus]|nr:hypothetical protein HanRHA438_Chr04g0177291 [Helianthus annuus]
MRLRIWFVNGVHFRAPDVSLHFVILKSCIKPRTTANVVVVIRDDIIINIRACFYGFFKRAFLINYSKRITNNSFFTNIRSIAIRAKMRLR